MKRTFTIFFVLSGIAFFVFLATQIKLSKTERTQTTREFVQIDSFYYFIFEVDEPQNVEAIVKVTDKKDFYFSVPVYYKEKNATIDDYKSLLISRTFAIVKAPAYKKIQSCTIKYKVK